MGYKMDPQTEKTWKSLVYNVRISSSDVKEFYDGWAGLYDQDQVKLKTGAEHLAHELVDTLKLLGREVTEEISVLDVACGTGLVGEALARRGFKDISGLDFCRAMLDIAQKKGVYKHLVETTFDCVVMKGGFA